LKSDSGETTSAVAPPPSAIVSPGFAMLCLPSAMATYARCRALSGAHPIRVIVEAADRNHLRQGSWFADMVGVPIRDDEIVDARQAGRVCGRDDEFGIAVVGGV
jgi:hypothetical protein